MLPNITLIKTAIASGRIFSVTFIKRSNGAVRKMVCRTGVKSHLSGGELKYDAAEKGLITVFDMQAKAYRSISVESIMSLRIDGVTYTYDVKAPETVVEYNGPIAIITRGECKGTAKIVKGEFKHPKSIDELLDDAGWQKVEQTIRAIEAVV